MSVQTVTSVPSDELLSVEEAKRHLRVFDGTLDDEVASLIRAARDYCERYANRTLRATVTRTFTNSEWWCGGLHLPFPPLLSVTSVTYYDSANASQTLAAGNYYVALPTDDGGRVEWTSAAVIPSLYSRPDALTVTYTTGYASLASIPPVVVQAMKCKLTELWAVGRDSEITAARQTCDRLLQLCEWPAYA